MSGDGWRAAMTRALYGPAGFYVGEAVPAGHFRTSAHLAGSWSAAILELAFRVHVLLGSPTSFTVVDVGGGGGELLAGLADRAPAHWDLHGVDLAPRPAGLPARVTWAATPPDGVVGLLVANELLDVVPVDVVELTADGPRLVEVTAAGDEQLGAVAAGRNAQWLAEWWPLAEPGDRAEIGWPRDDLWRSLTGRLARGVAVAVDYAAEPGRDRAGTLAAYRDGRQVRPVADGSCDLTAHVHFPSLASAGDLLLTQREALHALGVTGRPPSYDGDSATYLAALVGAGEAAELTDPSGLGGWTWLIHAAGIPNPFAEPYEMRPSRAAKGHIS